MNTMIMFCNTFKRSIRYKHTFITSSNEHLQSTTLGTVKDNIACVSPNALLSSGKIRSGFTIRRLQFKTLDHRNEKKNVQELAHPLVHFNRPV